MIDHGMSSKAYAVHRAHTIARSQRFDRGVYGVVQEPTLPKNTIGVWDPPTYARSRFTSRHTAVHMNDGIDRKLDLRCFYTGMPCWSPPENPPTGWNMDARVLPFMGTRDHLVPARRHVVNRPQRAQVRDMPIVWCSHICNTTLGLAPLPVRLKIRQWLMTAPYDRGDTSVESGNNLRWLIISYLNWFRINNRYPWSRNTDGGWWIPQIQEPFMQRCYVMEDQFLSMTNDDRDQWVNQFVWFF